MAIIKTLLVGYGEMGSRCHLPSLLASNNVSVVGIVRASGEDTKTGIPTFSALEQAFEKVRPDLAIISTPHSFHYQQALLCLEHNCHLLVEKPLTLSLSAAQDVARLAKEKEKLIVVGLQRRYEGFASTFRNLVAGGRLGEILLMHGLFAHRFSDLDIPAWRTDPDIAGAGIIDDSGFHLIDLLLYFAGGKVQSMKSRVLSAEGEKALPHSFTCFFDTDSGASISACASYLSPVNSVQEEITIWGTKGALFSRRFCKEWNTDPPQVFFKSSDGKEKEDFDLTDLPSGKELPLKVLLGVLSGQTPREALLTEAKDVLEAHRAIEMIKEENKRIA